MAAGISSSVAPVVRRRVNVGIASLIVVVLVAAGLRLYSLDVYPTGWHHDEALMGVMAGEVYRGEDRPIFFRQYLGQEPLYIYLAAGTIALLGGDEGVMPFRLLSSAIGLLVVVMAYAVGRSLFSDRVGLLASALTAVSFWQVMSSRMAYRSITQPLVEALAVILLWQARRRGGYAWYVATGAALGAVLYTYLGARAFPGVFVGFGLWLLVTRGRPSRAELGRAAVLALAAIAVAAPLAIFFLTNPGTFSARMEQVFVFRPEVNGGDPWPLVYDSAMKMLRVFTVAGEPMWRYNIPDRPLFVGALGVAFYVGLAVLVGRVWRRDDAAALVVIWFGVMLFPSVLSWEVGAYTLRAMGLVPVLFVAPALGLDWLWRQIGERWRSPAARAVATMLLVVIIGTETVWTARDYFTVWAPSYGASWEGHADALRAANFLRREARPEVEDVLVGSEYYHNPIVSQNARSVYPHLRWFDGRQSVVFSPDRHRPALYVLTYNGMAIGEVDRLFPREALIHAEYFERGIEGGAPPPLYLAYRLTPAQIEAQVRHLLGDPTLSPVIGRIPGVVRPLGARLPTTSSPGGEVETTLMWRVEGELPPGEYQMTAHLLDHSWHKISGVETLGYPVEEWRAGDVVWSRFAIPVPRDAAPGRYRVQVILYDRKTGQRLPVVDGVPGIGSMVLGDLRVVDERPVGIASVGPRVGLGEGITLLGADPLGVTPITPATARSVPVTLYWQADRRQVQDYTVFVQLLNGAGQLVAQSDSQPAGGALPTSAWLPGEVVRDDHTIRLPPDVPPGQYRVIVGMYVLGTGQRLPVTGGGDLIDLGMLTLGQP